MSTVFTPTGSQRPKSNIELTQENKELKAYLDILAHAILEGAQTDNEK